ncbi:MAG: prepilin-type N-terminal cleavage/methylation domain-containing protein [Thermodesulfobacteriota bacterium]|nr:prepilin-type N-terminal cleavage/methylation domain-containing protein [Thermodesulfobacteriota bacterium]
MSHPRKQRGFTLFELLIVIIIVGIISGVAIPHYLDIVKEAKIAAVKGQLAAIRGGIELAHAKILTSGINTGLTGDNPDWPTLEEVQFNELRLSTRPESIRHLRLVRGEHYSLVQNQALPFCNLPDMTTSMANNQAAVTGMGLNDATSQPRKANEASGWAYYPGNERDANGRAVEAIFYVNDDRDFTDNVDAGDVRPSDF